MPRTRKFETLCPGCREIVGVWNTPFNGRTTFKISKHHRPDKTWCTSAGLHLDDRMVIPVKES